MRQRRYQLLVATGLLMILAALFCTSPNSAIDVQIHESGVEERLRPQPFDNI